MSNVWLTDPTAAVDDIETHLRELRIEFDGSGLVEVLVGSFAALRPEYRELFVYFLAEQLAREDARAHKEAQEQYAAGAFDVVKGLHECATIGSLKASALLDIGVPIWTVGEMQDYGHIKDIARVNVALGPPNDGVRQLRPPGKQPGNWTSTASTVGELWTSIHELEEVAVACSRLPVFVGDNSQAVPATKIELSQEVQSDGTTEAIVVISGEGETR